MQRPRGYNKGGIFAEKSPTLSANSWQQNNLLVSRPKDGIRQLNPSRESGGTQQYRMLGNGWTVEVIKHILSFLPEHLKK